MPDIEVRIAQAGLEVEVDGDSDRRVASAGLEAEVLGVSSRLVAATWLEIEVAYIAPIASRVPKAWAMIVG
jgi:hypothetical protein